MDGFSSAFLLACIAHVPSASAQESAALVEKLVEKGVLTESEGDEVKSSLVEEFTKSPAGKFDGGKLASKITLFGDLRFRYEYSDSQNAFDQKDDGAVEPNGADSRDDKSRTRYRLRFGIKSQLAKNMEFGIRLATADTLEPIISSNETMGDAFAKDGIYVDWAYLKYSPTEWLTIWGGKYDQQFWTSDMLWSTDLTIEGATELTKFKLGKDTELFANFGQWVFGDINESDEDRQDTGGNQSHGFKDDGSKQVSNDDGWIFAGQAGIKHTFSPKLDTKVAVGYSYYANAEDLADGQKTTSSGIVYPNPGSGNNLGSEFQLLDVMFEANYKPFSGKLEKVAFRPYAHLIWNLAPAPNLGVTTDIKGDHSTGNAASNPDDLDENKTGKNFSDISADYAWRVGMELGTGKKVKGDWNLDTYYEEVGSDSVPDSFNDANMAGGLTNHRGFKICGTYMIKDWWSVTATYYDADWLDPDINQDVNRNTQAQARTVQLDTSVKF